MSDLDPCPPENNVGRFRFAALRARVHIRMYGQTVVHGIGYIKDRLWEPSTWLMFGAAIAGASSLPKPWSYMSLFCGVVAGMIPNNNPRP